MEPAKDATQDDSRFAAAMMVSPCFQRRRVPLAIVMCGRFTNRLTWKDWFASIASPLTSRRRTRARALQCLSDRSNPHDHRARRQARMRIQRWGLVPIGGRSHSRNCGLLRSTLASKRLPRSRSFVSRSSTGDASSLHPGTYVGFRTDAEGGTCLALRSVERSLRGGLRHAVRSREVLAIFA